MTRYTALAMSWTARTRAVLTDLVIPRACAACQASTTEQEGELCAACAWDLEAQTGSPYCQTCGEDRGPHLLIDGRCTDCRLAKPKLRFGRFVRVGRYSGTLRRLILRFKHSFVLDRLLGGYLGAAILGRLDPESVDDWVPVPAHWARRLRVGFQPTALLARAAVKAWHGKVVPALRTTRYIPPFHLNPSMAPPQRAEAVHGAFQVVDPARIAGRRVCVIDDVTTTGATLTEAKRALRQAGAASVWAAVLAKTSLTGRPPQGLDLQDTRP